MAKEALSPIGETRCHFIDACTATGFQPCKIERQEAVGEKLSAATIHKFALHFPEPPPSTTNSLHHCCCRSAMPGQSCINDVDVDEASLQSSS